MKCVSKHSEILEITLISKRWTFIFTNIIAKQCALTTEPHKMHYFEKSKENHFLCEGNGNSVKVVIGMINASKMEHRVLMGSDGSSDLISFRWVFSDYSAYDVEMHS